MAETTPSVPVMIKADAPKYIPQYAKEGDAAVDLCAQVAEGQHIVVHGGQTVMVPTGISIKVPDGYEAQVRSRSGLALKHNISVLNSPGTIDSGYTGEVRVLLHNHSMVPFYIQDGMRIAQLLVKPVPRIQWEEVKELPETQRGEDGFGSTGTQS